MPDARRYYGREWARTRSELDNRTKRIHLDEHTKRGSVATTETAHRELTGADRFARRRSAGKRRNLVAVWGRFGQESRFFGQLPHFHALYAKRPKLHRNWRLRISLIWRVARSSVG
jgi:hypothetical protein